MLYIDLWAQQSELNNVNTETKLIFSLSALFLCVFSPVPITGIVMAAEIFLLLTLWGKTPAKRIFKLLKIPSLFIILGCLTILIEFSQDNTGLFFFKTFGCYGVITKTSLSRALLLFFRAYGSVLCLYFLSLTTPMEKIINSLRKIKVPQLLIELMYLIYRYIFVLLDIQNNMTAAATSRLGYATYKNSWYTFSHISGNLLAMSFRKSSVCFDAMEARCYNGRLEFLCRDNNKNIKHIWLFTCCFLAGLLCTFLTVKGGIF